MAVIKASSSDIDMLARLMRAEAEGDGEIGMLNAGNVMVNRTKVRCLDFGGVNSIPEMVYQSPGGFEATQKGYFYQRVRERDKRLAKRLINGERVNPGEFALWFFKPEGDCPGQWWGQNNSGRYKSHCFYTPLPSECPEVYNTY